MKSRNTTDTVPVTAHLGAQGSASGPANADTASSFRAVSTHTITSDYLGPLADFPGFWDGTGFSLIARPDFDSENEDGFFLQLNMFRETMEFQTIGSPLINRGSKQGDIPLFGVTYLQRVTGQNVKHVTRLIVSTTMGGGVDNIPFIVQNAGLNSFDSVFAIERVEGPQGIDFMQLQCCQTAPLEFRGMTFPHVAVSTLVKAF